MKTEITPEALKYYLDFSDTIENKVIEIGDFIKSNDLRIDPPFRGSYDSFKIIGETIEVKFTDSWAYGGYDEHFIEFPISYLYLTTDEVLLQLEPTNRVIRIGREVIEENAKKRQLQKDLEDFNKLKQKLGK